ncbi:MAG: Txe/YoeB family addiction module toxin [Rickettsiales bacterium]|nr:MAG: Txe/YoeB family addiction module toxin [Rickettsiales bacterium]
MDKLKIHLANNNATKQYKFLQKNNKSVFKKLVKLLLAINENHYEGIGKPEALKGNLSGWWSRRITKEHRLVYRVENGIVIVILECMHHYGE